LPCNEWILKKYGSRTVQGKGLSTVKFKLDSGESGLSFLPVILDHVLKWLVFYYTLYRPCFVMYYSRPLASDALVRMTSQAISG